MKRYLLLVAVLTLGRVVGSALLPLSGDEAYYWDCSRHLDWSYFDQPPLIIWAMIPFRLLMGETALAVRAPAILANLLLALFLIPLVRRLGGGERETIAAYLLLQVMPIYFFGGSYASTDAAMVTAYVGATWAAVALAQGDRKGWWGFGVAFGLGFLAKFPLVLVAAVLIPALRRREVRTQLKTPSPYLAALLSMLLTAPVWIWGARHDWHNIGFQLQGRHSAPGDSGRAVSNLISFLGSGWDLWQGPKHLLEFVAANLALATPFLFVAMLMALWGSRRLRERGWAELRVATLTPLVFFGVISLKQRVGAHWGAPALVLGVVVLAMVPIPGRRWLAAAGAVCGLLLCLPLLYLVARPETLLGMPMIARRSDEQIVSSPIAYLYGADEIVQEVSRRLRPGELVSSNSYTITHLLAFDSAGELETRLADIGRGVHGLASLYWYSQDSLQGIDVLFLTNDLKASRQRLRRVFKRCRNDEPIQIYRQGRMVRRQWTLRCKDLREPAPVFTRLDG